MSEDVDLQHKAQETNFLSRHRKVAAFVAAVSMTVGMVSSIAMRGGEESNHDAVEMNNEVSPGSLPDSVSSAGQLEGESESVVASSAVGETSLAVEQQVQDSSSVNSSGTTMPHFQTTVTVGSTTSVPETTQPHDLVDRLGGRRLTQEVWDSQKQSSVYLERPSGIYCNANITTIGDRVLITSARHCITDYAPMDLSDTQSPGKDVSGEIGVDIYVIDPVTKSRIATIDKVVVATGDMDLMVI